MHDKDLPIQSVVQRQPVEHLGENVHDFVVVLVLDLSLKAVHFVHLLALVVASRQEEAFWVEQLPREKHRHHLDRERPAIDIVAVEHVRVGRARPAAHIFKHVEHIVKLPVRVSTDVEARCIVWRCRVSRGLLHGVPRRLPICVALTLSLSLLLFRFRFAAEMHLDQRRLLLHEPKHAQQDDDHVLAMYILLLALPLDQALHELARNSLVGLQPRARI
mmetsp:Transcript_85106/g.206340  ORF Transcript_85106/g.206340 Transcript_85106/m.206340 type:complete len:218 (-) Transcript_85106:138-791(-)